MDGVLDYLPNPAEVTNYAFDNEKYVTLRYLSVVHVMKVSMVNFFLEMVRKWP